MTETGAAVSRWVVARRDRAAEKGLTDALGIHPMLAAVLAQRGYTDPESAHAFLNPRLEDLHPPQKLPDFAAARDAILGAKERKEKIYVHGDYDVDGITSTAIFHRFLEKIGCDVESHVPHRMKEGFGIHEMAVQEAIDLGAKLFVTCDCGSAAHAQVAMAREAGMRVVVTDHHELDETLPNADAVINTHREDSEYPFPSLSGAGVVFKLCQGLTEEIGWPVAKYLDHFLDLAVLGTVADVMPLVGENRIIAKFGLERLAQTKRPGLRALLDVAEVKGAVTAGHIGFQLGPRLNAAGRIEDAASSLALLLETDPLRAAMEANRINDINRRRREEQEQILLEAVERVRELGHDQRNVIVVGGAGWHTGIVGIVASKIVETFHRPAIVLNLDEEKGIAKGSARSIKGFHLADAIKMHPELMTGGGHEMAAGCSFQLANLEAVQEALHVYGGTVLSPEDLVPSLSVDLEIDPDEWSIDGVQSLRALEPTGMANPGVHGAAHNVTIVDKRVMGQNQEHVKFTIQGASGRKIPIVAWRRAEELADLQIGDRIDVRFRPEINEYMGNSTVQWKAEELTRSGSVQWVRE